MPPVKEMAVAEKVKARRTHAGAGVEQAVCNIDGPDRQRQQCQDPQGKVDADNPGKGERPDQGD
jgi:hypothetical protein